MTSTNPQNGADERHIIVANGNTSSRFPENTILYWRERVHPIVKRPLTQNDLAHVIGVGVKQLARLEGGTRKPSLRSALRLWAVFGIPPQALFPECADEARAFVEERMQSLDTIQRPHLRQTSIYD